VSEVIWHELECGSYRADLALWRSLAERFGGPILDLGAGAGRVALTLARAGFAVTAVDLNSELLDALREADGGSSIATECADVRELALAERGYSLCVAAMQTVQLLGGADGRAAFLRRAAAHLRPGGGLAAAIVEEIEPFALKDGASGPLPDACERDGVLYCSQPTAVLEGPWGFELRRRRERVDADGRRSAGDVSVRLDRLDVETLEAEATGVGLRPLGRFEVPATDDHVGSIVAVFGA
jgi:SAM-dependent methyltransferase